MKRFLRFLQAPVAASIALAALMWAMPSACRAQTPYWTMLGYDAGHTGHNTAETSLYPPFPVDVSYVLGNGIGGISSHGELVFATAQTDTNRLVALDIANGVVYVGAWRETTTYAFDPATGEAPSRQAAG